MTEFVLGAPLLLCTPWLCTTERSTGEGTQRVRGLEVEVVGVWGMRSGQTVQAGFGERFEAVFHGRLLSGFMHPPTHATPPTPRPSTQDPPPRPLLAIYTPPPPPPPAPSNQPKPTHPPTHPPTPVKRQ